MTDDEHLAAAIDKLRDRPSFHPVTYGELIEVLEEIRSQFKELRKELERANDT